MTDGRRMSVIGTDICRFKVRGTDGVGSCPSVQPDAPCPYGISEQTGETLKLVPKYLPRDHLEYDVRTPKELRDKVNLYCTQPACHSHTCLNGGTCVEELDGYSCVCVAAYEGVHCGRYNLGICPDGWVYGITKCFLIAQDISNWQSARLFCSNLPEVSLDNGERIKPSLLFIESDEEFDLLERHVSGGSPWMNCNDIDVEGTWVCIRDGLGTTSSYRNWNKNQPDNPRSDCGFLYIVTGGMDDGGCSSPKPTVCQINIPS
ncbi:aggrecan core protein-like [Lytechinus pictus]|uniref:aggrecan core protein-like n=1 Tax=Lytechinus pictus TaxID=7653 RepID=UPI0030B9B1A9